MLGVKGGKNTTFLGMIYIFLWCKECTLNIMICDGMANDKVWFIGLVASLQNAEC